MSTLTDAPLATHLSPDDAALADREDTLVVSMRPMPLWKRIMDLGIAGLLLVCLSPLFLVVAVLIRCVSGGPVFFVQSRVGAGGRRFRMWKFRTMTADTDEREHALYVSSLKDSAGPLRKMDVRSRLIPGGALLRATALDELPQLINVLKGEMSLVGPRPDVLELEDYRPWQRRRFAVLPGISGLWQVSGKNKLTFDEMLQLDLQYVERRSFRLDVLILLRTIPVVLRLNTG